MIGLDRRFRPRKLDTLISHLVLGFLLYPDVLADFHVIDIMIFLHEVLGLLDVAMHIDDCIAKDRRHLLEGKALGLDEGQYHVTGQLTRPLTSGKKKITSRSWKKVRTIKTT